MTSCRDILESPPIDPLFVALVASRWVHFASMAALFGGALFWLAAARPADWPGAARGSLRLERVAAPLAALSGLGWELAIVASMGGDPASLGDPALLRAVLFESPFGPTLIGRLVLLAALPAVVLTGGRTGARRASVAVLAGLLLVSQAWLGHAAAAGDTPIGVAMMFAYACHIFAAAAWVGGLPPLLLTLRAARGDGAATRPLMRRVSTLATGAVVVLVAAGTANAAFRLAGPGELATTPYGRVLLVKLGLTATMLALAAYNRRSVTAARSDGLSLSVAIELALGVLVLGAAALLGVTPPPH